MQPGTFHIIFDVVKVVADRPGVDGAQPLNSIEAGAGEQIRARHPGVRVIVHPEVPWEVVQAADESGSTEFILKRVRESPVGSIWAVGTEIHLVSRLADELRPDRTVLSLDQFGCLCSTMFRVSPNHLLWVLEGLLAGEVHNRIVVPDDRKYWTKVALDRMLTLS